MKKVVRLNETNIKRIVKRVVKEEKEKETDLYTSLHSLRNSINDIKVASLLKDKKEALSKLEDILSTVRDMEDKTKSKRKVNEENEFYMDTNYSRPSYLSRSDEGPKYDIKAVDCGDEVRKGYADVNPDTAEIIVRYCKGNEHELDNLKKYGYELANAMYGFKDLE